MSATDFSSLALPAELLQTLNDLEYTQMTPVQAQSLPAVLSGQDVIAQAKTGSGKTAAFALGILAKLEVKRFRVQSLVLCPTRELAEQVAEEIRRLGRFQHNIKVLTLCGGVPSRFQTLSLEHGAHILVGTPGRVLDHLQQERIDFSELSLLVLDEADRMLDMGFQDDLKAIIGATPKERQTLLFSATYPPQIEKLAANLMREPLRVTVETKTEHSNIEQQFYKLEGTAREEAAMLLIQQFKPESCVLFCNTKRETHELYQTLKANGFSVLALHGDLEQKDRDQTLIQFNNKSARILVATDVAARGLDITALDMVINVQMAHDSDTHTHRIGRTGRAGESGKALTLVSHQDDYKVSLLQDEISETITLRPLPDVSLLQQPPQQASMVTLQIQGGKKHKLRPGDIVGALTRNDQIAFEKVGKIQLQSMWSYVAVQRDLAGKALHILNNDKLKGRSFRARTL